MAPACFLPINEPILTQYCRDFEPWKPAEPFTDRKERGFWKLRKWAVLRICSTKKGAMTSDDVINDIARQDAKKAVLAAVSGQKRKLIGYYKPMFLTTLTGLKGMRALLAFPFVRVV